MGITIGGGNDNTLTGYQSGYNLTTGSYNTFSGDQSGYTATNTFSNVFMGYYSGYATTTGGYNSFYGTQSGGSNTTGQYSTYIGLNAGYSNEVGNDNVFLGHNAGFNETGSNKLYIATDSMIPPLIYGEFDNNLVRINGNLEATFGGSDTANNHNMLALDANNAGSGSSDVGFSMENKETNFKWTFRTYAPTEGFAASKIGTGGTEFQVDNTGTDLTTTVVQMGGVTVFESGHLVTASSRSLKTDIKPLDREAALDAFHKLQPVSYAYKAHKDEPVVGFIAEDVPELVAMPSRKTLDSTEIVAVLTSVVQEQDKKIVTQDKEIMQMKSEITELKAMKQKVAMMESILTNLALDSSKTDKTKVSLNLK